MATPDATVAAARTPVPATEEKEEPSTKATRRVASAQAMKPSAAGPYIRSQASVPGFSTLPATGAALPARLLALALMTTSKLPVTACMSST